MRITNVTTGVGDGGETFLGGGQKVSKDSLRVETYGSVDELNSQLGVALAEGLDSEIAPWVRRVQNELFHLGSDLCVLEDDKKRHPIPQIEARHVEQLEGEMEKLLRVIPPLEEFVLPGGTRGASVLHVARTVCRRAERQAVALSKVEPLGPQVLRYLNRLSDWLFVLARFENRANDMDELGWDKNV